MKWSNKTIFPHALDDLAPIEFGKIGVMQQGLRFWSSRDLPLQLLLCRSSNAIS